MNKRQTGSEYESKAAQYLRRQGLSIIERNYRSRRGEIDLIAKDGEYLVFAEVKYRRTDRKGTPEEAVDYRKQLKICRVADYYRMTHGVGEFTPVRYDVVACYEDEIIWYRNAFEHIW